MALRKSWTWMGAFGPELMLCSASVRVGLIRRSWTAVWDGSTLREGVRLDLRSTRGTPIEASSDVAWTRKTPLRVRGEVLGRSIDLPGLLDESGGRHARRTSWLWSAGAGVDAAGRPVFWNHVEGLFEGECCVWVDGVPSLVGRLPFDGLDGVGELRFEAVARRARRENYLVLMSDYEQPFGRFTGSLPVAGPITGHGVMERHEALW